MKTNDLAYHPSKVGLPISKVAIAGASLPVELLLDGKSVAVFPTFELSVDLPGSMRGINASRSAQLLCFALKKFEGKIDFRNLAGVLSEKLLELHEYSNSSFAKFKCRVTLQRKTLHSGVDDIATYLVEGSAKTMRTQNDFDTTNRIKVSAFGMTACPCAQQNILALLSQEEKIPEESINLMKKHGATTHVQRAKASLSVQAAKLPDFSFFTEVLDCSFSIPISHVLKRYDEARLILSAVKNPKFAEDVARDVAMGAFKRIGEQLADSDEISVRVESFESIHPHNLVASSHFTGGELKRFLA